MRCVDKAFGKGPMEQLNRSYGKSYLSTALLAGVGAVLLLSTPGKGAESAAPATQPTELNAKATPNSATANSPTANSPTTNSPTTNPATTNPATLPAMPAVAVPDDLSGARLAIRAQQAFNRGEYALALPLLQKMAAESEGLPAKLASVQERIRVCEKAIASAKDEAERKLAAGIDPQAAMSQRPGDTAADARKPHPAPEAGKIYEMSIQELGNFNYDEERGGNVPADITGMSGAQVRLRGFMIPMDSAENITQFALVPSLFACCFGQPPAIQHTIVVTCPKGKAVGYSADELIVEGKLTVRERKEDGYIMSLFEMEVASVKLAPKG